MSLEIRLRRYRPDDIDATYEAVMESKAELLPWMPWCHEAYSRADAAGWVESRPHAWETNDEWSFVIVDAADRILGGCGIHRLDLKNGVGEAGYWVRTTCARQGIATKAVGLLCEWSFDEMGLVRIEILAAVGNLASQKVAEKAGGVHEAVLRQRIRLHGRREDCVLFAILKDNC